MEGGSEQDENSQTFPPPPLPELAPPPAATMSEIAIEKGSFTFEDERHHGGRSRAVPALVAHTYTHSTGPTEQKTFANPAPL